MPTLDAPERLDHPKLLRVETDRAVYHLHPGNHSAMTELSDALDAFDALVVEEAVTPYERVALADLYDHRQYRDLLEASDGLPVYLLDLPEEGELGVGWRWEGHALVYGPVALVGAALLVAPPLALVLAPLLGPLAAYLLGLGPLEYGLLRLRGLLTLPWCFGTYALRGAAVAAKLEGFVAPMLADERGRKPRILLDYGAMHLDLAYYLRSPRLRGAVLRLHGLVDYGRKDATYLDRICEFDRGDVASMSENRLPDGSVSYKKLVYELEE